jgi:tetratricopeptide (TPR) repeat protein
MVEELDRTTRRYRLHALVREAAGACDLQRRKHAEGVPRLGEQLALVRNRYGRLAGSVLMVVGEAGGDGTWEVVGNFAYSGFSLTRRLGRLPEALEICERMVQETNRTEDTWRLQAWYGNQAVILQTWGRLDEAMALHEKKEVICLELGNRDGLQASYGNQAGLLKDRGRLEEAMALLEKQEAICLELGDQDGLQQTFGNQAVLLNTWGHLDEAMTLLKKKEVVCLELGHRHGLQQTYGNQALNRKLYATGKFQQKDLADRFDVSRSSLRKTERRESWKHL